MFSCVTFVLAFGVVVCRSPADQTKFNKPDKEWHSILPVSRNHSTIIPPAT